MPDHLDPEFFLPSRIGLGHELGHLLESLVRCKLGALVFGNLEAQAELSEHRIVQTFPIPLFARTLGVDVPGHEAAGKVVAVGSAVTYTQVGDHVVLSTFGNCGHCADCEAGEPGNCAVGMGGLAQPYAEGDQPLYNFANLGAFVQETIVSENQCIPIPKEMPLTSAALIGCGVMTGTGAVFNRARVGLGDSVVVIGAGGVGLNVIQAAKLVGAKQIIAIDRIAEKEQLATAFGATDFLLAADDDFDAIGSVKALSGGGVHHAFEVVGHTGLLADAIQMTRAGGNICAVGVPDLTASVTYNFQSLYQNKNLMGIRAGGARPRKDFRTLADLYMTQIYWLVLGAAGAVLIAAIDYRHYERHGWVAYGAGMARAGALERLASANVGGIKQRPLRLQLRKN